MSEFDVVFARDQFPAFSQRSFRDLAFFENAGGSFPCRFVIERLARVMRERRVQPGQPSGPSRALAEEMEEARHRLTELLDVGADELVFGPSTSQNVYVLAQAFAEILGEGDAIVVTDQDHEANSGPWRRLAARGVEVREWRMDPVSGHLDPGSLAALLDRRVRLVAFPHASNVVGEVNPARQIVEMVHAAGAFACVDGVSMVPHGLPDIGGIGADVYLFSAYKTWGPHLGVMALRRELAELLPPQGHWFNATDPAKRFLPAGPDFAQIAAAAGIADYLDALAACHGVGDEPPAARARAVAELIRSYETKLLEELLPVVTSLPGVRLLGPQEATSRVPTLALVTPERGEDVARRLAERGIACAGGDFYAPRALSALGVAPGHGVLRLSFIHYNTSSEIRRLAAALEAELQG